MNLTPLRRSYIDPLSIAYHRAGSGPSLLLLHGFGYSADTWREVIPDLAAHFEVVAVDLPGFGLSAEPAEPTPQGVSGRLLDGIQALGLRDLLAVGHSYGAHVALRLALAAPDRVRGVVATSVTGIGPQAPWLRPEYVQVLRAHQETLSRSFGTLRGWINHDPASPVPRPILQRNLSALGEACFRPDQNLFDDLKRISTPTLFLWGQEDRQADVAWGEAAVREMPDARLRTWPACGHLAYVERRRAWLQEVIVFGIEGFE
ncbi:MAG: alpha/beta fold hydrolase [Anaerolineae bacterium]